MEAEEIILICAVRYAMVRMSYMVGVIAEYVAVKQPELSKECIDIIIRDIEEELERYHKCGQTLCMECDGRTWVRLLEMLKGDV